MIMFHCNFEAKSSKSKGDATWADYYKFILSNLGHFSIITIFEGGPCFMKILTKPSSSGLYFVK